ncbi:hypothetical protein [Micromonospora sp. NPDC050495]|uniref:hypothetical protein n=1 Tax=Micromonospora sp. NPDC050495 TaxID=3154936 RepID=UPI0033EC97EB
MSQDLPIPRQDHRSDDPTVVEWGDTEPSPPGRLGTSLAGLARDHRLPPLLVGLGAVAAIGSLVGEWLVMTVPNGGPEGNVAVRIPGGVAEVSGFGVAYLVGLLGLAAAVALALRGTPAVRHNARVAGLGLGATVLAVLIATAASLDHTSQRSLFFSPEDGLQVEYGRGLVSAFAATVLLTAALYLSDRARAGRPGPAEADTEADPAPAERIPNRRRRHSDADGVPAGPADLTVQPTVPFARPEPPR